MQKDLNCQTKSQKDLRSIPKCQNNWSIPSPPIKSILTGSTVLGLSLSDGLDRTLQDFPELASDNFLILLAEFDREPCEIDELLELFSLRVLPAEPCFRPICFDVAINTM